MEDSIVTDETVVSGDPLGRNAAMASILEQLRPQETVEQEEQPKDEPVATEEFTLNVLGQEVKAPKEKVIEAGIRALQKESAADERLRVASQKEQEIEQRLADLKRMEEELLTKKVEPDAVGKEFASAIFDDEEKVASVITSITREITDLKKEVVNSKRQQQQTEQAKFESVVKHYNDTFADIASDKAMHTVFNMFRADVLKNEPDPYKATEQAAKMVYQKFGMEKPEKPSTREIKEKLSPQPQKASARVKTPDPPQPKTLSQTLDEMRGKRSQK